jgi:hypothetical protein
MAAAAPAATRAPRSATRLGGAPVPPLAPRARFAPPPPTPAPPPPPAAARLSGLSCAGRFLGAGSFARRASPPAALPMPLVAAAAVRRRVGGSAAAAAAARVVGAAGLPPGVRAARARVPSSILPRPQLSSDMEKLSRPRSSLTKVAAGMGHEGMGFEEGQVCEGVALPRGLAPPAYTPSATTGLQQAW